MFHEIKLGYKCQLTSGAFVDKERGTVILVGLQLPPEDSGEARGQPSRLRTPREGSRWAECSGGASWSQCVKRSGHAVVGGLSRGPWLRAAW